MEELIRAIQELGNLSWIDYVQLGLTIVTIIISALALFYAIRVPKKIAEEQNKIALFEKRYEVFQLFERCISFNKTLQKSETIEDMRKDCMLLFDELKYEELDSKIVMKKVYIFEHTLHQMEFLFPGILEKDVHQLYSSLWKVLIAIIGDENVNECKKDYINVMSGFAHKYYKTIWNELYLSGKQAPTKRRRSVVRRG